jgi:hypothetical protein
MILASVPSAWAQSPTLVMDPASIVGAPGQTVVFHVRASVPNWQITGLQFSVGYDSDIVQFVSASISSDLGADGFQILNLNPNAPVDPNQGDRAVLVQIYGGASNWFTGTNQDVAVLTFQITQQYCGVSPIRFSAVCARTQMVTFALETLCNPQLLLVDGTVETTCVSDAPAVARPSVHLEQNVPNPFNPRTTIAFSLPQAGAARLQVRAADGRLVRVLVDGVLPMGNHSVEWDGRDTSLRQAPSGVYYSVLTTASGVLSRRMLLLK